jgi:type VI secretion system protein ImpJ
MWNSKVIWSEGMFLRPQHFQQQERFLTSLLELRSAPLAPYPWGFTELKLDDPLLALGKVGIASARGVLPDGTPFNIPADDNPPPALDLPEGAKNQVVMLTLPLRRPAMDDVDAQDRKDSLARFAVKEYEARDANADAAADALLQVGALRLRLTPASEPLDAYACLGVVRVVERRPDGKLLLDEDFVPPCLDCQAGRPLAGFITELRGLLRHRGEELAAMVTGRAQTGVAEVADFLLLQCVNRAEPLFAHLEATRGLHPETLFQLCLQLAGDLATFAHGDKRPSEFPAYRHDDLQATFAPVMEDLRRSLSLVLERNALSIPLEERQYGVRVARVADRQLFRTANFILAVNARVPAETLRQRFPTQVKIGPVEKIRDLVNLQLPGIMIHALPVVPRQIPFHAGFSYFEIERGTDLWNALEASSGMALHVAGDFPELALELWAIRG